MSKVFEEQAIRFLRGEENPFDAFVVPDKPAHEFPQCHVQEVHGDQFEQIGRVIDKYRFPDYRTRRQLYETRVLIVRGTRGSGKTHLLHVLRQRDTPTPEIWVCPRYFDPAFPFCRVPADRTGPHAAVVGGSRGPGSAALVRPRTDAADVGRSRRVARSCPSGCSGRFRLRTPGIGCGGTPDAKPTGNDCWTIWPPAHSPRRWPKSASATGSRPQRRSALVMRHVERTELGTGTPVRMRREVLLAFAELALRSWRTGNPRMLPKMGQAPGVHDPEPVPFSASPKMGQAPGIHDPEPVPFSGAVPFLEDRDAADRLASLLEQDFVQPGRHCLRRGPNWYRSCCRR
jgi:hypothetical protein